MEDCYDAQKELDAAEDLEMQELEEARRLQHQDSWQLDDKWEYIMEECYDAQEELEAAPGRPGLLALPRLPSWIPAVLSFPTWEMVLPPPSPAAGNTERRRN